jgi:hypothetical protein
MLKISKPFFFYVYLCHAVLLNLPQSVFAQLPQDLPYQTDPVDFDQTKNIIFFIVLPLVMIVAYILLRRRARWRKKQFEEENSRGRNQQH